MNDHLHKLEDYSGPKSRGRCVLCGENNQFAFYVNKQTGERLAPHVGRCNRELKCGYHYTPKQYFADSGRKIEVSRFINLKPVEPIEPIEYIPLNYLEQAHRHYNETDFYTYLVKLFGEGVADEVSSRYLLGASSCWKGATLFPQIDINGNFCQCKVILYNPANGKRRKKGSTVERFNKLLNQYQTIIAEDDCTRVYGKFLSDQTKELNLQQTFFGAHLLTEQENQTVAIVESEATAIIASIYFPDYIWIATGGKYGCKWADYEVNKILANRKVILFPDAGKQKLNPKTGKVIPSPFEVWTERANQIAWQTKAKIHVSDLLERMTSEEQKGSGWDLRDYLLNQHTQQTQIAA